MTLRFTYIFASLFCLFSLTGCIEYEDVEFLGVQDYSIDKVNSSDLAITIKMKVKNPNKYNIKIKKSTFELFLNDKKLGKANMLEDIKLPKESTEVHEITFVSAIKDLSSSIFSSLGMIFGRTSKLRIKGKVKAKAYGISKKFDVDVTEEIKASDLKF